MDGLNDPNRDSQYDDNPRNSDSFFGMSVQKARTDLIETVWIAYIFIAGASVGLPFAIANGSAPLPYLALAPLIGISWLAGTMLTWRIRNRLPQALAFLPVIFGSRVRHWLLSDESWPFFWQWLCLMILTFALPLVLFRKHIADICRLDERLPS